MRKRARFGSLLCATIAVAMVALIGMTAFGSAALAQQAHTSQPSWHGRFESTHVCEGPHGRMKVHHVGDLTLDHDGNGNLTGRLAGTIPENLNFSKGCSETMLAPGTFSARLVGSYTPGLNTFSAQALGVQITGGRKRVSCAHAPGGDWVGEIPAAYHILEAPMFGDAFRDLRREPDGSLKSKGEQTVGYGGGSCRTTYSLTLRGTDCLDRGFVYAGTLDGRVRSEPSSNASVVDSPPSGTRLRYTRTQQINGQTWYYVEPPGRPPGWFSGEQASCTRPTNPPLPRIVIPIDEGMKRFQGRPGLSSAGRG